MQHAFSFSLAVSVAIFLLIALRQWLPRGVRIWHIMTAGAALLLASGQIAPGEAARAVDWNVIAYLFGVFSVAAALFDGGISYAIGDWFVRLGSHGRAFFMFIAAAALSSAVLTNDAAAVIGTPIALMLAYSFRWPPVVTLIVLCVAVTLGSMLSPVGNPQNILIATSGITSRIETFALWLGPPALLSLAFAALWYWRRLGAGTDAPAAPITLPRRHDHVRAWPSYLGVMLLVALVSAESLLAARNGPRIPYGAAGLAAAAPIYLLGNRRFATLKGVDWTTLLFFVAMFVVTGALLKSGSLQALLGSMQSRLGDPAVTAVASFWGSQLFSNVPLVDIYLKLLPEHETANLMMLAGMSTLAGNLFIISAASNVIVVQQAERLGEEPFTFWQFTAAVVPVTIVSAALTYGWIALLMG
jgi:Na+/H+ antiporter NhaD/arsenite permease-like protein